MAALAYGQHPFADLSVRGSTQPPQEPSIYSTGKQIVVENSFEALKTKARK